MLFLKRESREIIIGIILASCVKWEAEINGTKLRFDFATSETQRYSKMPNLACNHKYGANELVEVKSKPEHLGARI